MYQQNTLLPPLLLVGGFPPVLVSTSPAEPHNFARNSCTGERPAKRSGVREGEVNAHVPKKENCSGMWLSPVSPVLQRG